MSSVREQIIKLAKENPELRKHLVPLLKEAMEFPTQEALKKYLDEHPDADKTKHKVKETKKETPKNKKSESSIKNRMLNNDSMVEDLAEALEASLEIGDGNVKIFKGKTPGKFKLNLDSAISFISNTGKASVDVFKNADVEYNKEKDEIKVIVSAGHVDEPGNRSFWKDLNKEVKFDLKGDADINTLTKKLRDSYNKLDKEMLKELEKSYKDI